MFGDITDQLQSPDLTVPSLPIGIEQAFDSLVTWASISLDNIKGPSSDGLLLVPRVLATFQPFRHYFINIAGKNNIS